MFFSPGQEVNKGRYKIIKNIGSGGFGIAYLAQDNRSNRQIVIKTLNKLQWHNIYLNPDTFEQEFDNLQQDFINEAIRLAQFDHPHIVKIYPEMFKESGLQCMVMEYVKGKNLSTLLLEKNGTLSEPEALNIIKQIGEALQYLHSKNWLHRDIKLDNILLRSSDNKAILIDFGIAREADFSKTVPLTSVKSPAFAPPEQFETTGHFTPALDIFALAGTLYVLLAVNEPPFIPLPSPFLNAKVMLDVNLKIIPPCDLNPKISKRVNDAILKGMELKAVNRPQSIDEWFQLLGIINPPVPSLYHKLEQFLAAKNWKDADQETANIMLKITNRENEGWLDEDDCKNFPPDELKIIDQLWVKHSNGHFGFSVQKEIFTSAKIGGKVGEFDWEKWCKFGEEVGWRKGGKWLGYSELSFDDIRSNKGHLPDCFDRLKVDVGCGLGGILFSLLNI